MINVNQHHHLYSRMLYQRLMVEDSMFGKIIIR